jgi:hypothetical protein
MPHNDNVDGLCSKLIKQDAKLEGHRYLSHHDDFDGVYLSWISCKLMKQDVKFERKSDVV